MPTVKDFGSFKIHMYFEDHNPPHVHLIGPDFAAKMDIQDQSIFAGDAPSKAEKQAARFIADHKANLMKRWNDYSG